MTPTLKEMQEKYFELVIKESIKCGYHIDGEFQAEAFIDDMKDFVLVLEDEEALKEWYEEEMM